MPPRFKQAPKLKKPVSRPKEAKSRRGSYGKRSDRLEIEEEIPKIEDPSPKLSQRFPSWLDRIPNIRRDDEDLHRQLSKERHALETAKHIDICRKELNAILNLALDKADKSYEKRRDFMFYAKANFLQGLYHEHDAEIEVCQPPQVQNTMNRISADNQILFGVKKILENNASFHNKDASYKSLVNKSCQLDFEFDANPELESVFKQLMHDMKPYCSKDVHNELASFPFLLCVVGPPGSGKSTICQYISSHFDVVVFDLKGKNNDYDIQKYINSSDDKGLIAAISSKLHELPESKGAILKGFPDTKQQTAQFLKSLQAIAKKRGDGRFVSINGFIRTNLTIEEVVSQTSDRIVDQDSGFVFHPTFNPPNAIFNANLVNSPISNPSSKEFVQAYQKITNHLINVESLLKKICPTILIGYYESSGQLFLKIESFLKQIYRSNNTAVLFNTFVVFKTKEEFFYSKMCYDIDKLWREKCIPIFNFELCDIFSRLNFAIDNIKYLANNIFERFSLLLSHQDERKTLTKKFLEQSSNNFTMSYSEFFNSIWEKSIEIRSNNFKLVEKFMKDSPILTIKNDIEAKTDSVFTALLNRYFIVEWFSNNLIPLIKNGPSSISCPFELPDPTIPEFNSSNFNEICGLIGIPQYLSEAQSNLTDIPQSISFSYLQTPQQLLKNAYFPQVLRSDSCQIKKPNFASRLSFTKPDSKSITLQPRAQTKLQFSQSKSSLSKDESVMKFIEYVIKELQNKTLVQEMKLFRQQYLYFLNAKREIIRHIDEMMNLIQTKLKEMVQEKYSHEMEKFSDSFRKYKLHQNFDENSFQYDVSCLSKRNLEIYQEFDGNLPMGHEYVNINPERLQNLYTYYSQKEIHSESLSKLLIILDELKFTEHEKKLIGILVRMNTIPDFIDILNFIESLLPDNFEYNKREGVKTPSSVSSRSQKKMLTPSL